MRRVSLPDVSTAHLRAAIVDRCSYAVVDDALSPTFPLGDALEVYVRREDAERFIEEVRGDEPELAKGMRNEERELQAGELN